MFLLNVKISGHQKPTLNFLANGGMKLRCSNNTSHWQILQRKIWSLLLKEIILECWTSLINYKLGLVSYKLVRCLGVGQTISKGGPPKYWKLIQWFSYIIREELNFFLLPSVEKTIFFPINLNVVKWCPCSTAILKICQTLITHNWFY